MKLFFTLIVLLFAAIINSVGAQLDSYSVKSAPALSINSPVTVNKGGENVGYICRVRASAVSDKPLIVIDGVPYEFDELKKLDPNDIASIYILKESTAGALYGCRAARGAVIITTKAASARKFIIKDFLTGQTIPLATICFSSGSDSIMTVANDSGILVTDKLKTGIKYDITVSSAGYKTFSTTVKGKEQEVLLEKDVKTCGEVIVSSSVIRCGRCCRHSFSCKGRGIKGDTIPVDRIISLCDKPSALVYPNPVQRNNRFTIQLENGQNEVVQIVIISLNGSLVFRDSQPVNKGLNRFSITADAKWAAGIYNIQLRNEKGTLIRQEKLIVQ